MKKHDLREMKKAVLKISQERDWEELNTPKNLAMDVIREAGEMLEHFIWETNEEIRKDKKRVAAIGEEIADVLHALLLLADSLKIDLGEAFWRKLEEIKQKYPVADFKGISGYDRKMKLKSL